MEQLKSIVAAQSNNSNAADVQKLLVELPKLSVAADLKRYASIALYSCEGKMLVPAIVGELIVKLTFKLISIVLKVKAVN